MRNSSEYPIISVTVDLVLRRGDDVLMIRRGDVPFKGLLALPGGYLEPDETLRDAAYREGNEEVGLLPASLLSSLALAFVADEPGRDPRGPTISAVFYGLAANNWDPEAGDDAASFEWVPLSQVHPDAWARFAFDHGELIRKTLEWVHRG